MSYLHRFSRLGCLGGYDQGGVGITCMERGGVLCHIMQRSLMVLVGGIDGMYDLG